MDKRGEYIRTYALASILVLVVGGFYFAYQTMRSLHPEREKATGCPTGKGPVSETVVLLDATDPYNQIQRLAIETRLDEIVSSILVDAKLTIYKLDTLESLSTLGPLVARCNPGKEANALYESKRRKEVSWREGFDTPIRTALEEITETGSANTSEIMEMLQVVGLTAFTGSHTDDDPKRELIIVSDMLQHTPEYSHYRDWPMTFKEFEATPTFRRLTTSRLVGVRVKIIYVRRQEYGAATIQGRAHVDFWEEYIAGIGGFLFDVDTLEG